MSSVISAGLNVAPMQPLNLGQLLNSYQQSNSATQQGQANVQQTQLSNQTANVNLQTLDQLNKARLNLIQQQGQFFPVTATSGLLQGLGRLGYRVNPGAAYQGLPALAADQLAANNIRGVSNLGSMNNPMMGLSQGIGNIVSRLMPGSNLGSILSGSNPGSAPNPQNQPIPGQAQPMPNQPGQSQPMPGQRLPMSPAQTARLGTLFGNNSGAQPMPMSSPALPQTSNAQGPAPGSAEQASQVADQLDTKAANSVSSPAMQQKYNYVKNMMATLSQYGNPAVTFSKYMGPTGWARYQADSANPAMRNDPTFINYNSFRNSLSQISADQLRQFLSTSVQPHVMEELQSLTNPQNMRVGAPGAAKQWDDLLQALHGEGNTAAQSAGKSSEFNSLYPSMGPQDVLNNMRALKQNGENAGAYFGSYSPQMRDAIKRLYKGGSNG